MGITVDDFRERLEKIESLPTLPVICKQMQALVGNPNSNMSQIATLISRDQAIAGRVIRLVNSAFYGLRNQVSSIQQAIVVLGLNTVKNLTMGISVIKIFETNKSSFFDHEQFWLHSFATAQMAKYLAKELKQSDPEDCFLAGLLHDIGFLVFDQFFHIEYVEAYKTMLLTRKSMLETEEVHFGINHAIVGSFVLKKWQLPPFLADVVHAHHNVSMLSSTEERVRRILAILCCANSHTHKKGIGNFIKGVSTHKEQPPERSVNNFPQDVVDYCFAKTVGEIHFLIKEWGL